MATAYFLLSLGRLEKFPERAAAETLEERGQHARQRLGMIDRGIDGAVRRQFIDGARQELRQERGSLGWIDAELEWRFFDPRGELLYACETTYLLATEAQPSAKVMAVIAHNEVERYEEALKRKKGG